MPEKIIWAKRIDKDNGYCRTQSKRLFQFKRNKWNELHLPQLNAVTIHRTNAFLPNELWVAGVRFGEQRTTLFRITGQDVEELHPPNVDNIISLFQHTNDSFWIGCNWGEMLSFEDNAWIKHLLPTQKHISFLWQMHNGNLWGSSDFRGISELLRLTPAGWTIIETITDGEIVNVWPFRDGIILKIDASLWLYEPDNPRKKINIPFSGKRDFHFDLFNYQNGYLIDTMGHLFAFSGQTQKFTPVDTLVAGLEISLSKDGFGWLYYPEGVFYTFDKPIATQVSPVNANFFIHRMDLSDLMGAGFIAGTKKPDLLYLVDLERENRVAQSFLQDKTKFFKRGIYTRAADFGLAERQESKDKAPTYDAAVLVADFNNDAKEDVFLTAIYGQKYLFFQQNERVFADGTSWAGLREEEGRLGQPATSDFDGDGDLDLCLPRAFSQPDIFVNNGKGQFTRVLGLMPDELPKSSGSAVFANLDKDKWPDLILGVPGSGIYMLKNINGQKFGMPVISGTSINSRKPEKLGSPTVGDYDNDGDLDVLGCKLYKSNSLYRNDGDWRFTAVTEAAGLIASTLTNGAV
ncbi:MAG: VCBS repeat-containing protein, partial [Calditrichaeota bacterium]